MGMRAVLVPSGKPHCHDSFLFTSDCLSLPALSPSQHCSVWGTQPPHDPINGLIFPQCVAVFDNTAVSSSLWGSWAGKGSHEAATLLGIANLLSESARTNLHSHPVR